MIHWNHHCFSGVSIDDPFYTDTLSQQAHDTLSFKKQKAVRISRSQPPENKESREQSVCPRLLRSVDDNQRTKGRPLVK
jgi:hypothetical protein